MNKAFTLIELLVVVLIIGILSAIALPQYTKAVGKTKYVRLLTLSDAVMKAEEVYYLANNEYAEDFDMLDLQIPLDKLSYKQLSKGDATHSAYMILKYADLEPYFVGYFGHVSNPDYRNRRECRTALDASDSDQQICASLTGDTRHSYGDSYSWKF